MDTVGNDNVRSRLFPAISYLENGDLEITNRHEMTNDKSIIDGRYFSDRAPLPIYLLAGTLKTLNFLGLVNPSENGNFFSKSSYQLAGLFFSSIPFVIILLLTFREIEAKAGWLQALLLSTLPFFASFLFTYVGIFFGHVLAALFLFIAYLQLKKLNFFQQVYLFYLSPLTKCGWEDGVLDQGIY